MEQRTSRKVALPLCVSRHWQQNLLHGTSSSIRHWSCSGERVHPIRDDFGSLIRREIGECMAQFQPNFEHICHAALAQFAQEHQAR